MTVFLKDLIEKLFYVYTWNIPVLIIVLILISVLYLVLKQKATDKKTANAVFLISFAVYFALMIYVTLVDRNSSLEHAGLCLIPFHSYYRFFFAGDTEIMLQAVMNIAFFYPFGFFLRGLDFKFLRKRKWLIVVFAFLFSLSIEVLQYIFSLGYAEVDDVIHNTSGAVIGILVLPALEKLLNKIIKHFKSKT